MDERQVVDRDADIELLRKVYDGLDVLEARLNMLALPGKSEAIDLVLQLRRKVIEEFPHVETGAELEADAS